ncbi:MAG: PAS domain-containing protein, partial [Bacteroidota bacterium]|nr:PAS domain-containing protein [Bacteroidota bacterium]
MLKEPGDQKLLAQLFDNQPDSVVLFAPVFSANTRHDVIDFEVKYCNNTAAKLLGTDRSGVVGVHLLSSSLMDKTSIKLIYDQCITVWNTAETIDYVYYSPGFDRYFDVQRSRVQDCILSVTRDRTREMKSELENKQQSDFLNRLIDNSPYGVVLYQAIRDEADKITDFKTRIYNQKSIELTGLSSADLEINTMKSLCLARGNNTFFDKTLEVAETGNPAQIEYYSKFLNRWLSYSIVKFEDGVLLNYFDISRRKLLEEETKQQAFVLDQIINASLNAIFMCEAVRDPEGAIIDFTFLQINEMYKVLIGKTAEEVIGKTMLQLFPSSRSFAGFTNYCRVIETGEPARFELQYQGDGLDAWYGISTVKVGANGVVVTFADITERKKAELEREQQNHLIQTMLNAAFHGKALLEPVRNEEGHVIDFTVIAANSSTEAQIGIKPETAIGRRISTLLPAYNKNGAFDIYTEVLTSGKSARAEHFYRDHRIEAWFDVYVAPVRTGIVVSFSNITERKQELLQIEQQKNLLDAIMAHSPSGISVTEIIRDENGKVIDGRTLLANEAAVQFVGIPKDLYLTKTARELDPKILESPVYQMTVETLETGKPFHTQYFLEQSNRWLEMSVAKMDDNHLINVFTDVTSTKEVELQVQNMAEKLKTVINTSQAGFFLGKPVVD